MVPGRIDLHLHLGGLFEVSTQLIFEATQDGVTFALSPGASNTLLTPALQGHATRLGRAWRRCASAPGPCGLFLQADEQIDAMYRISSEAGLLISHTQDSAHAERIVGPSGARPVHPGQASAAESGTHGDPGDSIARMIEVMAGPNGWPMGEVASATEVGVLYADIDVVGGRSAVMWPEVHDPPRDRRIDLYDHPLLVYPGSVISR